MRKWGVLGVGAVLAVLAFVLVGRQIDGPEVAKPPTTGVDQPQPPSSPGSPPPSSPPGSPPSGPSPQPPSSPGATSPQPPGASDEFTLGVWEYFIRDKSLKTARAKMRETKAAGFEAAITNAFWVPGQTAPFPHEMTELRNAVTAATEAGVRPMIIVQHVGSRTTPRTAKQRREFAALAVTIAQRFPQLRDFVVANEPNLNRFWLPQFGPNGENLAARDYLRLLTVVYDSLKRVSKDIRVIGGALAPRGGDDPNAPRHTHSPTKFIKDLGRYYRESGRKKPVMDAFAHHPYLARSKVPPDVAHPRTTTISLADYDKLVKLLGEAFDGTAQAGSDLPIHYTEFGVQTVVPPGKRKSYSNFAAPAARDAVSEAVQARYYRQAVEIACSQPTVEGIYFFHVWDEIDLLGWQSGLYYADRSPKTSRDAFRDLKCER